MLKWSEKLETGHLLIDAQHRMLISYVNRLEGFAQNTDPGREEIELFTRFLEFLETYTLTHFKEEEDCMHRFRCPAHRENKQAHGEFLDFFRKFRLRIASTGYHSGLVRELHECCNLWIQQHILRTDSKLKPCLNRPSALDEPE